MIFSSSWILRIPLEPAFEAERVPVTMYNVVKDETYCGGVNVSLKFTHQVSMALKRVICFW